jgi:aspartyl-tRNA(Asn)/glutamyl-tRNA(Gln) amidotransferase subunit A
MAEIAGYDPHDPASSPVPVPDFYKAPPKRLDGIRLGIPKNFYFDHVDGEVAQAVQAAAVQAVRLGAKAVDIDLPDIAELNATARFIQWGESSSVFAPFRDASLFGADVWALIEEGRVVSAADYVNAQRLRSLFRRQFDEVWRNVDFLITPTTPITAPCADVDEVDIDGYAEDARIASTRLTRAVNLLGEPALSVPCGRSNSGLPIGIQLIAPPFTDAWLLRIGQTIERELA